MRRPLDPREQTDRGIGPEVRVVPLTDIIRA
jgi:hypothetical protein